MTISSKLKLTTLLTTLGLLLSASPAWAQPCAISATVIGGTVNFSGTCPSDYRDSWELRVAGVGRIAQGSGANVSASGTFATGSYTAELTCIKAGTPILRETCSCNFTVTSGATPTPTLPPSATPTPPVGSTCSGKDIPTGLGCIPTDPTGLVNKILQIAIGVSSGIALLLLISGAFKVLTSSGDPKSVMEGKDTITSAIGGLLLILLSVAILNIIGIKILNIPIWGG